MATAELWFERKFDFPISLDQYPSIRARLESAPARLADVFRGSAHEARVFQPGGKWSAQEQAGHLLDLEPLWYSRLNEFFLEGLTELRVTDLTNRATTDAGHNQRPLEDILRDFAEARNKLLRRMDEIGPPSASVTRLHPRMKVPMTVADHLFFVAEHDDYHLANIRILLSR
jgi:uncharacterized damage-inducible protein DinB